MSSADLARLELAKRAYQATQPREAEVSAGVRRARLALTRPKRRRAWFSKGLVLVVLALGSLAYAKPQAMGELIERASPRKSESSGRLSAGVSREALAAAAQAGVLLRQAQSRSVALEAGREGSPEPAKRAEPKTAEARASATKLNPSRSRARSVEVTQSTSVAEAVVATPASRASATTDWGRVGQALARGDNTEALSALGELSESDDQRTRDKADLGRAQLLMAHDEAEEACALARSLTHRRAGGRIERQAQLLLKSCKR